MSEIAREVVPVHTASRDYDVIVGTRLLDEVGDRMRAALASDAAFVVSDTNVAPLYLERVEASLRMAGFAVASTIVEAGESHKNLTTFGAILEDMASAGLTRDSIVVALGGGVVGDMAGFAAASYMRGIRVVQVPTSLLSMVDSSVGGKTAIDLSRGKNLVGAFLQPSLVIADVDCLSTLSPYVFVDGIGEVVKHGVLADEQLFDELAAHPLAQDGDPAQLTRVIARNVAIKRDVVGADEKERGVRQTLNLGHTIGHAFEAASCYALGHGHCVAAGLCHVARASEHLGWSEPGTSDRIERCVAAQGLPTSCDIPLDDVIAQASHDKKRHGAGVNLVVPTRIGAVTMRHVSLDELATLIREGARSPRP
ncbi:MAG: 3-dehydroquinate synthase [Atopobiaceae bacterium]|nr:3-dehydroquinate synthase [Atopobiaceae bacterium]